METPQIDGYILLGHLGRGSSATVFAARKAHNALVDAVQEECAVKVYTGERATEKFRKEVQYLQAVCGHPNVAELLASCEGDSNAIVMPLYRGCNLDYLVRQAHGLPEVATALVMKDVLAATQHVHHRGLLHRDIKPANILVTDGKAVLIDFDVACPLSQVADPSLPRAGTVGYTSPENALRQPYGTPSDLFSIGCTLYFMFGKKPPFRTSPHSDNAVLQKTVPCKFQFDVWFDDVSEACKRMISSLVVREPAERLSIEQALQHEWLSPRTFSRHTSAGSGKSSSDAYLLPRTHADATVARAQGSHQPSTCEAEHSVQDSQGKSRTNLDAEPLGSPQSSSCRSQVSRKPEPRPPNGKPTGPVRRNLRRGTCPTPVDFRRGTCMALARHYTEPTCSGSAVEVSDLQ
eukprot:TRINITY_DN4673_c0_g1_i1.p1 TRINITY_DN4673_c0_g1~~TRINITY_DN4673_c0_g1_i1.p1  ORF type:complete len:419 (-),score=40.04 TRINITY_DN4673_c0_g1_i1:345-1559(-)